MARTLLVALLGLGAAPAVAQEPVSPASSYWPLVRPRFSGERAKETVAFLDQFVRWPGNRGFDASITHLVERLERAGYVPESRASSSERLIYRVERYPMAAPAWEPLDASLSIAGEREPVLRFSTNRNMLATNSFATPPGGVDAELVDAGDGAPARLDSLGVRGKVVLARTGISRLFTEAVVKRGAAGVLAYSLPGYLQPEKNRNSIQFGGVPRDTTAHAWGIVLSYAAHERLRAALARGPVGVQVRTNVRWTPNAIEQAVVAEVRGQHVLDERFVFSAHVQEPGANDNASGVGAQVEMARVAAELVKAGLVSPARTITMLWGLEIRSTERYITQDTARARGIRWGLSLDMVGEDTRKTGGTFLIEKMPDPSAIWTRGEDKHSEWGGSPISKAQLTPHYFNDFVLSRCREQSAENGWVVKTNPFEGGSDHTPFLRAGKPGLLFWHFTDQFYHTDGDRIDMVSADELRNVGMCALVSAFVLASADRAAARAIIREVATAALARLAAEGKLGAAAVASGGAVAQEQDILETWATWYRDALAAAAEIETGGASRETELEIARARGSVDATLLRVLRDDLGVRKEASPLEAGTQASVSLRLVSPDGRNSVTVDLRDGSLRYTLGRDGRAVLLPSRLGFAFRGAAPLGEGLRIVDTARTSVDTTWTQPWGEVAQVRDHHNELRVRLSEVAGARREFVVVFRVFNDGIGFRYELPAQPNLGAFEVSDELTEFAMADNAKAWWIPSNRVAMDRYEMLYASSPVSMLDSVRTPLTMEMQGGPMVVLHEAHLEDYAAMDLARVGERTFRPALAPWADGVKVRGHTPFNTPWRTVQLADRPADLAPSLLGLNLNPPNRIADPGWIRPMKYNGIWWGMHAGLYTWNSGPRHGATTANALRHVDFAAANGLAGTLVEGWNVGWDGDWIGTHGRDFSFTTPYPDYDLRAVAGHARAKGVSLIVHNETAMGIGNYERQLDSAFALYRSLGVTSIKTGYVNDRTAEGHAHTGQVMVRHHRKVIETAARYGITVNAHEPIMDTGERRTWPNMLSREGARGQEYNAGGPDGGNPPEHETILFFTRLLAGPLDYTPGVFDILLRRSTGAARTPDQPRVRTTLAKQLALYVVLYSPVQMAADVIENYDGVPAFRFIRDVAVDWDTTRVLAGRIGDYVVVARRERGADRWFIGAITDEAARTIDVPLSFLSPGRRYVAEMYADGPGAHWLTNPLPITMASRAVNAASHLRLVLAPGGGQAVRIRPAETRAKPPE